LIDKDPEYLIRAAFSVDFLDPITAKAWGVDITRRIIVDLKFSPPHYLEDKKVPIFSPISILTDRIPRNFNSIKHMTPN
jgi:hypothetical protein